MQYFHLPNTKLSFYRIHNQIGSQIMFQIKGQVQPSHLSNLQPYRLISHLCDKGHPNTFYLPNLKPNKYKISCFASRIIERQIHPSYLLNFKPYRLKSHFRDKGYSNTFILPNTKQNMFKYYSTNQGKTYDKSNLLISQTCNHRGQNLNFTSRVILFYRI